MGLMSIYVFSSVVITVAGMAASSFDPRQNVWVTLSRTINTTTFCASLATPSAPFYYLLDRGSVK